jgi:tRNA(Arg) A34 adenosine deaminase TadA
MDDDHPMRLAIEESKKSSHRYPIGAAIVRGNKVLSKAFNVNKTHPKYGSGKYQRLHAEGHAIYRAVRQGIDLSGASIYIYRRNNTLAKPCPCCMGMIHQHGIKEVIYSGS